MSDPIRDLEPQSLERAVEDLTSLVADQRARLARFRDSAFLRRFSETATRQRSSLVTGMMNSSLRTDRRWNQELQKALERPGRTPDERRGDVNGILADFGATARRIAKEFVLQWHFGEAAEHIGRHESVLQRAPSVNRVLSGDIRSRASSRADSNYQGDSRRNSPTPDIDGVIAERRRSAAGVSTSEDEGPWATPADEAAGLALRLSLCESPTVAKRATKEANLQLHLLGLLIDMAPDGRLPVTVHPTCVCTFAGHSVRVSAAPARTGPSIGASSCPELALALEYAGEVLNIARYDCAEDSGKVVDRVGPPSASAFEGTDGRLYLETVLGFFPHFPPAQGSPITSAHTLFLRPEAVASHPHTVSPGAFVTFGGTSGPKLREQTAECAKRLCREAVPRLAKELATNPPSSAQALISERMKPIGLNVALLGMLLHHVPGPCEPVRCIIFTEMLVRAARWRLEEQSADESEGVIDAFKDMCARVADPDRVGEALEELLPIVHVKFPGSATLLSKQLRTPTALLDADVFTQRLAELHGMVLARGVTSSANVFHITVERMRVRVSRLAVGPGIQQPPPLPPPMMAPPRGSTNDLDASHSPEIELLLGGTAGPGQQQQGAAGMPPRTPTGGAVRRSLEMQQQRARLLARALVTTTADEGLAVCKGLSEVANDRSLRTGKGSFAFRYELFTAGCHVAHVLPDKGIHFLTQAMEGLMGDRASLTMVRCLCERARLFIDAGRMNEAQTDLDDATPRLRIAGGFVGARGGSAAGSPIATTCSGDKFSAFDDHINASAGETPAGSLGGRGGSLAFGGVGSDVPPTAVANAAAIPMFQQLARLHQARGDLREAEEALKSVLSITIALQGEYHLDTAAAFGILGFNLFSQGPAREAEAVDALEADMRICRAVDGDRSVHMAASTGNLAVLLTRSGRHEEAVELHRLDDAITAADPAASPLDMATAKSGLGVALTNVGQLREAQAVTEEALRIRVTNGGSDMSIASVLSNLGKTLILRFRDESAPALLAAAEGRCLDAIAVTEANHGPAHKFLRVPLEHLSGLYAMRGDGVARDATAQRIEDVNNGVANNVPFRDFLTQVGHAFAEVSESDAELVAA